MDAKTMSLTGPDFLDAVADAESAHGNNINAEAYRNRAAEWANDRRLREEAEHRAARLERRLADIAIAAKVH